MNRKYGVLGLLLLVCIISADSAAAQSASAEAGVIPRVPGDGALPANSSYLTTQISYMFNQGDDFLDGMIGAVAIKQDLLEGLNGSFVLPVLVNLDALDIINALLSDSLSLEEARDLIATVAATRRGVVGGFYPYWFTQIGGVTLTLHAMAGYKGNAFSGQPGKGEEDATAMLHQLRSSLGAELMLPVGNRKLTAGAALADHRFDPDKYAAIFGERKSRFTAVELHGIVPAFGDFALMSEWIVSGSTVFADQSPTGFRVGVLYVKKQ